MSSASASSTATGSSSSSSSSSSSLQTLDVGESCTYYGRNRMSGCRWPRTCNSCLDISGCMINGTGWCVSTTEQPYDATKDYTIGVQEGYALPNATANATDQDWQFRAGKVTYCSSDDSTCQQCVRQNFWRDSYSYPDSHFCVGTDGCVCVDVCERRWYVTSDCPAMSTPSPSSYITSSPISSSSSSSVGSRIWQSLVAIIAFVLFFLIVVVWRRKRMEARRRMEQQERQRRHEARHERRHDRAESLGVNALNLSGWETYRRDLIDKEKTHLSGGGTIDITHTAESGAVEITRTTEGSESSDDEHNDALEIRSPRAQGDASAVYVSMDDTQQPTAATTSALQHGTVALTAQRDALPILQLTAPRPSH